jgi:AmmeMemoRadiSam system protein A
MSNAIFGVISPHPPIFVPAVGGAEAHVAQASLDALEAARVALSKFAPETLVLMSPHAPAAYDSFVIDSSDRLEGSLAQFGDTHRWAWRGDPELADALIEAAGSAGLPVVPRTADPRLRPGWLDHATIVPLSFLEPEQNSRLVVLSLSYCEYSDHRRLGEITHSVAEKLGRRVAFVASGDMSHRLTPGANAGYSPRGAELDTAIVSKVTEGRFTELMALDLDLVEAGGECGLRSLITLGGFAGEDPVPSKVLSYEGPWGVGYLTALVGSEALDAFERAYGSAAGRKGGAAGHDESEIVKLARSAIESHVRTGTTGGVELLVGPEYPERAGAFVSLHRGGMLRGCIGTITPTRDTLAEEVAANAVQAATRDPRFEPLTADELDDLDVKVDVLHTPESCTLDELDPTNYGVIVTSGYRRGLLLPDLEGVDDVNTQIAIAMQKAGIQPGSRCELQRFKVDRYT